MKKMMMIPLGMLGGMTLIGWMIMKKNPEIRKKMKEKAKEMTRQVYNQLDQED